MTTSRTLEIRNRAQEDSDDDNAEEKVTEVTHVGRHYVLVLPEK